MPRTKEHRGEEEKEADGLKCTSVARPGTGAGMTESLPAGWKGSAVPAIGPDALSGNTAVLRHAAGTIPTTWGDRPAKESTGIRLSERSTARASMSGGSCPE